MIFVKVHLTPNGKILAMCDSDLIGKSFEENDKKLDLEKFKDFYSGVEKTEIEAIDALKDIDFDDVICINAVGKQTIEVLKKSGFKVDGVKKIKGVPMLQIFFI